MGRREIAKELSQDAAHDKVGWSWAMGNHISRQATMQGRQALNWVR